MSFPLLILTITAIFTPIVNILHLAINIYNCGAATMNEGLGLLPRFTVVATA
jgi:hypothetical protein